MWSHNNKCHQETGHKREMGKNGQIGKQVEKKKKTQQNEPRNQRFIYKTIGGWFFIHTILDKEMNIHLPSYTIASGSY